MIKVIDLIKLIGEKNKVITGFYNRKTGLIIKIGNEILIYRNY